MCIRLHAYFTFCRIEGLKNCVLQMYGEGTKHLEQTRAYVYYANLINYVHAK